MLPDAKPGQVFAYDQQADGTVLLTPVTLEHKEHYPVGSLDDADEWNKEFGAMGAAMAVPELPQE